MKVLTVLVFVKDYLDPILRITRPVQETTARARAGDASETEARRIYLNHAIITPLRVD